MPAAGARPCREGRALVERAVKAIGGAAEARRGHDLRRVLFAGAEAADRRRAGRAEDDVALSRRHPRRAHDDAAGSHDDERQPDDAGRRLVHRRRAAPIRRTPRGARPPSRQLQPPARAAAARAPRGRTSRRRPLGPATGGRRRGRSRARRSTAPSTSRSAIDKASGLVAQHVVHRPRVRGRDRRLHDRRSTTTATSAACGCRSRSARSSTARPIRSLTRTIDAIAINPPLDAALFEPAPAAVQ